MHKAMMHPLALTLLLTGALPVAAVEVGSLPAVAGGVVETRFAAQPDQRRAWLEVTVLDPRLREESSLTQIVHQQQLRVPGLAFDAESSTIVWSSTDGPVTCARVEWRRILWSRYANVVPTGMCSITPYEHMAELDDGIRVRSEKRLGLRIQAALPGSQALRGASPN